MKLALSAIVFISSITIQAQSYHYYNDIVSPADMANQMKSLVQNKVSTITATGYTPQGAKASDFSETTQVLDNGKTLRVSKISGLNIQVSRQEFDNAGRLVRTIDSAAGVADITTYEYDQEGRISKVSNTTTDDSKEFSDTELHQWFYTADGKTDKMIKTINGADSVVIKIIPEDHGLPGEEVSYKNGRETDHVYYYYNDDKNRLTDIVRFNKKINKLVPEVIFSYDDADHVIQRVVSAEGDSYGIKSMGSIYFVRYLIWRYIYNEQGLKTKEALFDKNQELTGKIVYTYTYH